MPPRRLRIIRTPSDPAREFLILVGAPSNTFNGWQRFSTTTGEFSPMPAPADASPAEIRKYLRVTPPPTDPEEAPFTHDLYWADFLLAAVKSIEVGVVQPAPGDIVTIVVYIPPFQQRNSYDWTASPYNSPRNRGTDWVGGVAPYNNHFREQDQGALKPPPNPRAPIGGKAGGVFSTDEGDINHQILMSTTLRKDELPESVYPFRQMTDVMELQCLHDVPVRLVGATPFWSASPKTFAGLKKVLVKLLLMRDPNEFFTYLDTGRWTGQRWPHVNEFLNVADRWSLTAQHGWLSEARPGKIVFSDWLQTPNVDRARVKIKRFDYFGHSGNDADTSKNAFFLQYGWTNPKGSASDPPRGEVMMGVDDLEAHLSSAVIAPGSFAKVWGCHATEHMAPMLATVFDRVEACDEYVDYNKIVLGDEMPEPRDAVTFPFRVFRRQP